MMASVQSRHRKGHLHRRHYTNSFVRRASSAFATNDIRSRQTRDLHERVPRSFFGTVLGLNLTLTMTGTLIRCLGNVTPC
jgi:hypothetical protein